MRVCACEGGTCEAEIHVRVCACEGEMGEDETRECVRHLLWVKQFVLDEGEEGRDHFRANQLADDD